MRMEDFKHERKKTMNFDTLKTLSKGQVIQVFLINGENVKSKFAGVACGSLFMSNCTVTNRKSISHKVNNAFVPVDSIKELKVIEGN